MPGLRRPVIHGRDHAPGGADPIPNWPTGGGGGGGEITWEDVGIVSPGFTSFAPAAPAAPAHPIVDPKKGGGDATAG